MIEATKSEFIVNVKTLVWVGSVVIACLFGIKNIVREANEELYNRINLRQQIIDVNQDHKLIDHDKRIDKLEIAINGGAVNNK